MLGKNIRSNQTEQKQLAIVFDQHAGCVADTRVMDMAKPLMVEVQRAENAADTFFSSVPHILAATSRTSIHTHSCLHSAGTPHLIQAAPV